MAKLTVNLTPGFQLGDCWDAENSCAAQSLFTKIMCMSRLIAEVVPQGSEMGLGRLGG